MQHRTQQQAGLYVLAEQIRENTRLMQSSRQEWKNAMLRLAIALWKARQHFSSNQEFGHWLVDNELEDLSGHDRAALINMAEHLELTERVFAEMESNSIRFLWDEVQQRLASAGKTTSMQTKPPEVAETPLPSANSSNGSAEKGEKLVQNDSERKDLSSKNPLRKHPRAEEIWATYKNQHTRAELVKAMAKRSFWRALGIDSDGTRQRISQAKQCLFKQGRICFAYALSRGSATRRIQRA